VTQREARPRSRRRLRARADALAGILQALAAGSDLDTTLGRVARAACQVLGADRCSLALLDDDGLLRYRALLDDPGGIILEPPVVPGEGLVGRAFAERRVIRGESLAADDALTAPHHLLCAPVVSGHEPRGVLVAERRGARAFRPADERLAEELATYVGLALQQVAERARADELARLSAELSRSDARFRALTASLLEAVYETDMTQPHRPTGVCTFYSDNVTAVMGYPPEAWYEDDALFVKHLHPDDRAWVLEAHDVLREHGETMDIEYRWVKPSGEVVWIQDRARLERAADGSPLVLRGTNADVSARKLLEEQLRRSEQEARALYQAALAIGGELDLHARLERVLDAALELTGARLARVALADRERGEIVVVAARGVLNQGPGTRQPLGSGLTGVVLAEGRPLRCPDARADPRTWNPGGSHDEGLRSWLGVPLADSDGPFGVLIVLSHRVDAFSAEDERRLASLAALAAAALREARLAQRLAEAEAVRELAHLKDEFLSTVSHELRTPLSLVYGYSELLLARPFAPEQVREVIGEINRAAQVMVRLVDDLLDLGRIERGELHLDLGPMDVTQMLREAAVRHSGHPGDHQLLVEADTALPEVCADAKRMRQILDNLIENALRYAVPGPIVLRAVRQHRAVRVSVEDAGPGLPAEMASRVFEKFYRAPEARLSQDRGTGIGLAVVKQLVEAQGGEVGVEPSALGGSSFWFRLPTA